MSAPPRGLVLALALSTGAVGLALGVGGAPLVTEAAPLGILSFEVAGDPYTAAAILEDWAARGALPAAAQNLGLDALFLLLYPSTLGLLLLRAGYRRTAASQVLTALCDLGENVALLALLQRHLAGGLDPGDPAEMAAALGPTLTAWALATCKIALLTFGLLTVAEAALRRWLRRLFVQPAGGA